MKVKLKNPKTGREFSVNAEEISIQGRKLIVRELMLAESMELEDIKKDVDRVKRQIALSIYNKDMSVEEKENLFYDLTNRDSLRLLEVVKRVNGTETDPLP